MLARFSIRGKIIAVVAFLLLAMTGMGVLAVRNMRAINASTVDITSNWLPSVRALDDLRAGLNTYRNVIREHMLAETAEDKQAMEKILDTITQENLKIRQSYEPLISSPEERAIYNELVQVSDSYEAGVRQVVALSRNSVGKSPHEAHELNTRTVNAIGIKVDAILKKDIDLNHTGADVAARDASDNYAFAFVLIAAMLGSAIMLGIGVSFYLVRDVSRGIASIVKTMQALGGGDLTAQIPHQGEKTEIGAMADTLQVFKGP
jgi:methyl-accepting chemotaxis protein